jgi:hypothetical protein
MEHEAHKSECPEIDCCFAGQFVEYDLELLAGPFGLEMLAKDYVRHKASSSVRKCLRLVMFDKGICTPVPLN